MTALCAILKLHMKHLHTLIAITIVASLGYSQCTGGLFALPQALAASTEVFDDGVLMSLAPIECENVMETRANSGTQASKKSGCADGGSCLEQAQRSAIRFVATVEDSGSSGEEVFPALLAFVPTIEEKRSAAVLARAGPLYALATVGAHTTVKRE